MPGDTTSVRIPLGPFGSINAGLASLIILVLQNSVLVLMTRWSRSRADIPMYKTSTMVLMAELMKMAVCLAWGLSEFYKESASKGGSSSVPKHLRFACETMRTSTFSMETIKLVVPAALFTFQNYLLFVSLSNLDAMTFQVLSQVKLLLAALFSIWLLGRFLTCMQWSSVFLLMIGIAIASKPPKNRMSGSSAAAGEVQSNLLGVLCCVASGLSSSFAGVWFEKILKGTPPSVAIRNVQLGVPAIIFAGLSIAIIDGFPIGLNGLDPGFLRGFTPLTWVLASVHAGGGVLVAVVVKYADNILKGFATGIAIVASGMYAAAAWGFMPSRSFVVGSSLVCIGTVLYNVRWEHPVAKKLARGMPGGYRIPDTPQPDSHRPLSHWAAVDTLRNRDSPSFVPLSQIGSQQPPDPGAATGFTPLSPAALNKGQDLKQHSAPASETKSPKLPPPLIYGNVGAPATR